MVKRIPPYLSFRTFNDFLKGLATSELPARIDRTLLAEKSGSTQSQMLSALYYLGLTNGLGSPTQELVELVQTNGRERELVWERILRSSYPRLFELDVERATTAEFLHELVREGMQSRDTIRKALNFFCLASRAAGIRVSPHIKPYAGQRQSVPRDSESRKSTFKLVNFPVVRKSAGITIQAVEIMAKKYPEFNPSWSEQERANWLDGFRSLLKIFSETGDAQELEARRQRDSA